MRTDKYFTTIYNGFPKDKFKQKYDMSENYHNQWNIVCKAKSLAEANRIADNLGLYKAFRRDYTAETVNKEIIKICDKYGFIVNTNGTRYPKNYVDIKEFIEN